jgi:hypothetical protein
MAAGGPGGGLLGLPWTMAGGMASATTRGPQAADGAGQTIIPELEAPPEAVLMGDRPTAWRSPTYHARRLGRACPSAGCRPTVCRSSF